MKECTIALQAPPLINRRQSPPSCLGTSTSNQTEQNSQSKQNKLWY